MNRSDLDSATLRNCRWAGPGGTMVKTGTAPATYNTVGAVTYTAADILGGFITRDPNGASRVDVLPTAAQLVAAMGGRVAPGDMISCVISNGADAAETITINPGTGITFDANLTAASRIIGQNNSRVVNIRFTVVTAGSEAAVAYM